VILLDVNAKSIFNSIINIQETVVIVQSFIVWMASEGLKVSTEESDI
jgi:hypothetical protein